MHVAHVALAAFKLCNRRTSYDALRSLVVTASGTNAPSFDEYGVGVDICDAQVCCSTTDILLKIPISPPGCGASSVAPTWPDGAEGLGETEHVHDSEERQQGEEQRQKQQQQQQQQQQQRDRWDIGGPSRVVSDAGLGLGEVKRVCGTAAGAWPRRGNTAASEPGPVGEQLGGGGGWSGRRGGETFGDNHACGMATNGREGGVARGDGVGNMRRYPPLAWHQPHGRSGHRAPCFSGGIEPGFGPPFTEAAAVMRHRHEVHQGQEAPSNDFPAAGFSFVPNDDQRQVVPRSPPQSAHGAAAGAFMLEKIYYPPKLGDHPCRHAAARGGMASRDNSDRAVKKGSMAISDSSRGSGSVPFHFVQQGEEPLVDDKSGSQPLSYNGAQGGRRGGGGGYNYGGGGTAESSDLVGLLLDD